MAEPDGARQDRGDVKPNSRAVVPGEVTLIVDIRDPDAAKIDAIDAAVRDEIRSIAAGAGVEAEVGIARRVPRRYLRHGLRRRDPARVREARPALGDAWSAAPPTTR